MINVSGRSTLIGVDGGIHPATAGLAVAAGARVLVAGSAVFGQRDYADAIRSLREIGQSGLSGAA
jgi:ribulose-phosphate 3-epimerase